MWGRSPLGASLFPVSTSWPKRCLKISLSTPLSLCFGTRPEKFNYARGLRQRPEGKGDTPLQRNPELIHRAGGAGMGGEIFCSRSADGG